MPVFLRLSRFLSHRLDSSIHFRTETNTGRYVGSVSDYATTGCARGTTLDTSVKSIVITAGVREICALQKALVEQYLTIARFVISKRRFIRKALVR